MGTIGSLSIETDGLPARDAAGSARRKRIIAQFFLLAWLSVPMSGLAHGGVAMEKDMCKLKLGPYVMHFTGYQVHGYGSNMEFCEDIPMTGETIIVMDALDAPLREMPISVRIVRDTGTGSEDPARLDETSVVSLPAKTYPAGSVSLQYTFQEPGRFVGLVTAGEHGEYVSRFPFSVGIDRAAYRFYLLLAAVPVGVFGFYWSVMRNRHKRTAG